MIQLERCGNLVVNLWSQYSLHTYMSNYKLLIFTPAVVELCEKIKVYEVMHV